MDRRHFLLAGAATIAGPSLAQLPATLPRSSSQFVRWTMFSRHLQCLTTQAYAREFPYETGVIIGEGAAAGGFNAINLTVRIDGHVEPELVTTNLAPMLQGIRSTGTHCDHITTNVLNLQSAYAEEVLTTAAENGVRYYRWGTFDYQRDEAAYGQGLRNQLDGFRRETEALAAFNSRLGLTALYHTYSGNRVGASLWDLIYVLEGFDPEAVAINFDIGHMISEGVRSWINDLRFAMPYVRGASLKDATYRQNAEGELTRAFMAAGEGAVDWVEYFRQLLEGGFSGPAESHLEFDYLDGNLLNTTWWAESAGNIVTRDQLIGIMQSELGAFRNYALTAGWQASQLR